MSTDLPEMKYRTLGRSGVRVSVLSVGTGGRGRFGQTQGVGQDEITGFVRHALDVGINLFDTSPLYGDAESILGRALAGVDRSSYLLATKVPTTVDGTPEGEPVGAAAVRRYVESSLLDLGTDHLDFVQFHAVVASQYRRMTDELLPELFAARDEGLVRFIGITEIPRLDPGHETLTMALDDGNFDTFMVGYNLLRPTAERQLLPRAHDAGVGVIGMVAVRRALSDPLLLEERIADAKARGLIGAAALPDKEPLGWLLDDANVTSLPAAGYKYAIAHPAVATVLSGTTNRRHLDENVRAILGPPLSSGAMDRLRSVFGTFEEPIFE